MNGKEAFDHLKDKGLRLRVIAGYLAIAPRELVTDELRAFVGEHSEALTAHLVAGGDEEVAFRLAAFLRQLSDVSQGDPVPFLFVSGAEVRKGACGSCGEVIELGFRCALCMRAGNLALQIWFERTADKGAAAA